MLATHPYNQSCSPTPLQDLNLQPMLLEQLDPSLDVVLCVKGMVGQGMNSFPPHV
jgi:hypothetical protein